MRSVWRPMISRKRRTSGAARIFALVEQRLDVSAHGRERRAQLVRDVGHEVAANPIGAAQVGDVVQHEHAPVACVDLTGALRAMITSPALAAG